MGQGTGGWEGVVQVVLGSLMGKMGSLGQKKGFLPEIPLLGIGDAEKSHRE